MARKPTAPQQKTAKPASAKAQNPATKAPKATTTAKLAKVAAGKRTIPVHALGDDRTHLALPHMGKLRQETLKTLCRLQAVSALSPFALAEKDRARCPACFRLVAADLTTKG